MSKKKSKRAGQEPVERPEGSPSSNEKEQPARLPVEALPPGALEAIEIARRAFAPPKPEGLEEAIAAFGQDAPERALDMAGTVEALARALGGPVTDHGLREPTEENLKPDRRAVQEAARVLAGQGRRLAQGPLKTVVDTVFAEAEEYARSLRPPPYAPPRADWLVLLGGGLTGRCMWLGQKLREASELRSDPPPPKPHETEPVEARHGADFTWVSWFGQEFRFKKGNQAEVVRVLWEEWERGGRADGRGLSQETIGELVGSESKTFSLPDTLRGHPALGTMIRPCGRGTFALFKLSSSAIVEE